MGGPRRHRQGHPEERAEVTAILDANPLDDIRKSEDVRYVIANGRLYDAATMAQLHPTQVPAPSYFFERDGVRTDAEVRGLDGCMGCGR